MAGTAHAEHKAVLAEGEAGVGMEFFTEIMVAGGDALGGVGEEVGVGVVLFHPSGEAGDFVQQGAADDGGCWQRLVGRGVFDEVSEEGFDFAFEEEFGGWVLNRGVPSAQELLENQAFTTRVAANGVKGEFGEDGFGFGVEGGPE